MCFNNGVENGVMLLWSQRNTSKTLEAISSDFVPIILYFVIDVDLGTIAIPTQLENIWEKILMHCNHIPQNIARV